MANSIIKSCSRLDEATRVSLKFSRFKSHCSDNDKRREINFGRSKSYFREVYDKVCYLSDIYSYGENFSLTRVWRGESLCRYFISIYRYLLNLSTDICWDLSTNILWSLYLNIYNLYPCWDPKIYYTNKYTPNISVYIPQLGEVHDQILTTSICPCWVSFCNQYPQYLSYEE